MSRHRSVYIATKQEMVKLNELLPAEKQTVWQGIKKLDPAKADMMLNDKTLKELASVFDAFFIEARSDVDRYIAAVKKDI